MKKPRELPILPSGWTTREELIEILAADQKFLENINKHLHRNILSSDANLHDELFRSIFDRKRWQLTSFGSNALSLSYKRWLIKSEPNIEMTGKTLLSLEKNINSPWFTSRRFFLVWNEEIHFEVQMFDGDVHKFANFYF